MEPRQLRHSLTMYYWYKEKIRDLKDDLEEFDYYMAHGLKKGIELSDLELKSEWPLPKFQGKGMTMAQKITIKDKMQAKLSVYQEIVDEVDRHLAKMHPITRSMVEDHYMAGVSIQVLANRQDMKEETVKKRMQRAIIKVCT